MNRFLPLQILLKKEFLQEWRSKEILLSATLFSLILVVLLSLAFSEEVPPSVEIKSGILWSTLFFSGILVTGKLATKEQEQDTFRALLLCPFPRIFIYLSKVITFLCMMLFLLVPLLLCLWLFLHFQIYEIFKFIFIVGLGLLGFSLISCLFSLGLKQERKEGFFLPLLVYPLAFPLLLACIRSSSLLLEGTQESIHDAIPWMYFLLFFDMVAFCLGLLLFTPLCAKE